MIIGINNEQIGEWSKSPLKPGIGAKILVLTIVLNDGIYEQRSGK